MRKNLLTVVRRNPGRHASKRVAYRAKGTGNGAEKASSPAPAPVLDDSKADGGGKLGDSVRGSGQEIELKRPKQPKSDSWRATVPSLTGYTDALTGMFFSRSRKEALLRELAAQQDQHASDLAAEQQLHADALAAQNQRHAEELAAKQRQHAVELGTLESFAIDAVERLNAEHRGRERELESALVAARAEAEELRYANEMLERQITKLESLVRKRNTSLSTN